jgi:hypothetical protein
VALRELANHPSCLVAGKGTIRVEFLFENPLAITKLAPGGREMRCHVPLSTSALYSSAMAARH